MTFIPEKEDTRVSDIDLSLLPSFPLRKWLSSAFQKESSATASVKTQIWAKTFFIESFSPAVLSSQSILARERKV